ncbi:MAG: PAS domain S-box protein [Candidatus Peribacteraceae bacterium]|nr:PAS domain S-box protein [Candidatus Peribacteraceae bacterium]
MFNAKKENIGETGPVRSFSQVGADFIKEFENFKADKRLVLQIIDTCPIGTIVAGIDRNIVFFNKAGEDISGYQCDSVMHKDWSSFIHPDDRQRVVNEFRKTLHNIKTEPSIKCRLDNGKKIVIEKWSVVTKPQVRLVVYFYEEGSLKT